MTKTFRCAKCNQTVYEESIPLHAEAHLKETQGMDAMGNVIPSNDRIDFIPTGI